MSQQLPNPSGAPFADGPGDPEHDLRSTLVLEPEYVTALTRRVVATSGTHHTVDSPLNGQPLAHIPQSTIGDVAEAFGRARRAQDAWSRVPMAERAEIMLRFHDLVLDHSAELLDLIGLESGKARKHAFDEPLHVALTARYYARSAGRHLATRRVAGALPGLTRAEVNQIPKGVVGVISPWNYPLTMAISDGLAALMAGNGVVAKPDSQTMLSALLAVRLMSEAGFPEDLWQVVAGPGAQIGPALIERADYLCFTGSTATGISVAQGCADRLIGCSLELGGKNPILVLRDADVERAAEGAVRACFSNAGQLCVSTERMFVADQIYDRFVDRFLARTEAMSLGSTLDWGVDMGPLISADQLERVESHVADAVGNGAELLTGGHPRPDLGPYFFEPTVLTGVTPRMACFAQETFGPVVSVYRFHDEREAIDRANDGDYGLNAAIYSRDARRARAMASQIKCGSVNVNEAFAATFASVAAPMGGFRRSGLGRRQGAEGILRFTESQTVATQRGVRIAPLPGMSDQTYAAVMDRSLRLLKRLGRA